MPATLQRNNTLSKECCVVGRLLFGQRHAFRSPHATPWPAGGQQRSTQRRGAGLDRDRARDDGREVFTLCSVPLSKLRLSVFPVSEHNGTASEHEVLRMCSH